MDKYIAEFLGTGFLSCISSALRLIKIQDSLRLIINFSVFNYF